MASIVDAHAVETIIGYRFRSGLDGLLKALTAAGAVEEDWDGNRKLAQFGTALSEFLLNYLAFEAGATRACASDFKSRVTSNEHRSSIAEQTGISRHIKFYGQEGAQSPSVLAKAVNAIIAVVYIDCGGVNNIVLKMMRQLGIFTVPGQTVNPALLSLNELPESIDVATLAHSLFKIDTGSHSSSLAAGDEQTFQTYSPSQERVISNNQPPTTGTMNLVEIEYDSRGSLTQYSHTSQTADPDVELVTNQPQKSSIRTVLPTETGEGEGSGPTIVDDVRRFRRETKKRTSVHQSESGQRKTSRDFHFQRSMNMFETYLIDEGERCRAFGQLAPYETFLTPTTQQAIQNLSKEKTEVLAKILIHIGSPCLIGGLQALSELHKDQESHMALETTDPLSRAQRFRLIDTLGHTMSRYQLLRRYHILELLKDCNGPEATTCGMVITPADFASLSSKRGNRVNKAIADVTARMMQETFPNMDVNTDEYKTKYRSATNIRRLGQRLHMLETRFGEGVLGLMLDQGLAGTDVGITDKMIMTPTDIEYAKFVDILDNSQGDLLRGLARAVLPAVQSLTVGDGHKQRLFDIGGVTVDDIVKYPKGSIAFLELIRGTR